MVYLRYRQARHLAGLGTWCNCYFYRLSSRIFARLSFFYTQVPTPLKQRPIAVQAVAQGGYGLFGEWHVYVSIINKTSCNNAVSLRHTVPRQQIFRLNPHNVGNIYIIVHVYTQPLHHHYFPARPNVGIPTSIKKTNAQLSCNCLCLTLLYRLPVLRAVL